MKRTISIFTILFLGGALMTGIVNAATPTVTETVEAPTGAVKAASTSAAPTSKEEQNKKLDKQINELKEKIASRVSELNLVEKRGMIGIVSEIGANQITLTDVNGKTRLSDVDEITKFSSSTAKSFGLSDITKGMRISVLGLYNKQSKRILARYIEVTSNPKFLSGAVSEIDREAGTLTLLSEDQKKTTIDIQSITRINTYNRKDDELIRYGFSKMAIGDRIMVVGFPDKKDTKMVVASRITVLDDLVKNPRIVVAQPTIEESESKASSGSGKKITPITPTKALKLTGTPTKQPTAEPTE